MWPALGYFLLVLLPLCQVATNARLVEPDWAELDKQIDDGKWCQEGDHCRSRNYSAEDDDEGNWKEMDFVGPSDMDDINFMKWRCHCEDECDSYGDCCYDAPAAVSNRTTENNKKELGRNPWTCLPLRFREDQTATKGYQVDERFYIYMIGNCPATAWSEGEDDLSALCERRRSEDYSHLMDLPVLSLDTNRTYANVYCARCNSDATRLASWNVSIDCDEDLESLNVSRAQLFHPSNYRAGLRTWAFGNGLVTCHFVVEQFRDLQLYLKSTGSRRCLPRKKEICASDWTDPIDEIKCQSYTLLVQDKRSRSSMVYKNPHCAKCNHIPESNIGCYQHTEMSFVPSTRFGTTQRARHSFSMLLDLNFGGGRIGGKQDTVCGANEIFDHINDRCHAITCGSMFVNQAGICVQKNETENLDWPSAPGTWLNSSCPRLVLIENLHYVQLDNGSIILNSSGAVLQPEEYEPSEDGRNVTICAKVRRGGTYLNYSPAQRYLSDICLGISIVCLALHITIHIALPKLRNLPGKNLLSLSCALFMAQLLFLTGMVLYDVINTQVCKTMGILVHWFFLAAFFWMNVMGFDICRTFAGSLTRRGGMPGRGQRSTFLYYSLYAWGFPTMIVSIGIMLDFTNWIDDYAPQYGLNVCWISNRKALGVFFMIPVAALLLENLFLFSLTVYSILQQRRAAQFAVDKNQSYRTAGETNKSATERLQPPSNGSNATRPQNNTNNKQQIRFILYIKLGLIMGLGWIFGFVAALAKVPILWYPFIFFNALQGAFIFFAFGFKRKVYFMMYEWATNRPHPSDTSSSSRTTTASSNKPSVSNPSRISYATPSTTTNDLESQSKRLSANLDVPQLTPHPADHQMVPQVVAVSIVRQSWINSSSSPASRAKRDLPRVVITKHFVNDSEPNFVKQPSSMPHLLVQNKNHFRLRP